MNLSKGIFFAHNFFFFFETPGLAVLDNSVCLRERKREREKV